ncbi:MAG: polyprenyl synthetase family protein [Anaerolineaceae bacterium]|nr:polyprenyl synthetase family protein [Anaerolineaceae bacterium]
MTATWQLIRLSAKLFDDVEDEDIESGIAETINRATGLLIAAQIALDRLPDYGISQRLAFKIKIRFNQVCLHTCSGQGADLSTRWDRMQLSPDEWLRIVQAKSGELFAWASWAGAVLAGANKKVQSYFWEYGMHLGILVQIADDFAGVWGPSGSEDLAAYRVTLPISYAQFVAKDEEQELLAQALQKAADGIPQSAITARDVLTGLGAQKFMLATAWIQVQKALSVSFPTSLSSTAIRQLTQLLYSTFPALSMLNPDFHVPSNSSISATENT